MMRKGTLNRDVTSEECSWLVKDLKKGHVVYEYAGYTYNCIGQNGVAVSDKPEELPFYEVPMNAVDWE